MDCSSSYSMTQRLSYKLIHGEKCLQRDTMETMTKPSMTDTHRHCTTTILHYHQTPMWCGASGSSGLAPSKSNLYHKFTTSQVFRSFTIFSTFGKVAKGMVLKVCATRQRLGVAFILFMTGDDALKAAKAMDENAHLHCCRYGRASEYIRKKEMKAPRRLGVWKMGVVNYLEALKLQDELTSNRKILKVTDILLSLQHPPTYTLGKRRTDHNILVSESELRAMGADLHYTQRGGDVTFHGPHQAILYPIISLRDIGLGARQYVEKLETTMIQLASVHGVEARAGQKGETGVWVGGRKIGAIGVRISSGITSHGLAFNINPDMNYFKHIVPCGLEDKEVTSLQKEVKQVLPPDDVIHEQLISCFASTFGYTDIIWKDGSSVVSFDQES